MFLTERQGGSDVGANTTRAVADGDEWLLFGDKHFCSNVDADVFIVLARPQGAPEGTRGLATFIVPSRQPDGSPNGFRIKRLKPKLGTVGVPTGEVTLEGARAWLAGGNSETVRSVGGARRPRHQPDDGDGQLQPLRCRAHGARASTGARSSRPPSTPRSAPSGVGASTPTRSCARRWWTSWSTSRQGWPSPSSAPARCAALADVDEARLVRRILIPLAKMRSTRVGAVGGVQRARDLRGERLHARLADRPSAARRPVPHHLGGHREHPLPSTSAARSGASRPTSRCGRRIDRALDAAAGHTVLAGTVDVVARTVADAWEAIDVLAARRRTWPSSSRAGSPSCWPTSPRGRS